MFTRIQEFKDIETAVKFCVKFVREHRIVKKAYLRLCNNPEPGGKKGTMVLMYPDTRFGYVDLMLESFQLNIGVLERLVDEDNFEKVIANKISTKKVNIFIGLIQKDENKFAGYTETWLTDNLIGKVKNIRKIVEPISKIILHLESSQAKSSWVNPLFRAWIKDYISWKEHAWTRYLQNDTKKSVGMMITDRWFGSRDG